MIRVHKHTSQATQAQPFELPLLGMKLSDFLSGVWTLMNTVNDLILVINKR